jgi:hypothetical protein
MSKVKNPFNVGCGQFFDTEKYDLSRYKMANEVVKDFAARGLERTFMRRIFGARSFYVTLVQSPVLSVWT